MTTSKPSMEPNGQMLIFSQPEFLASLHPAPASREARLMTGGSGRKLCASLDKSDPLGAFSRILLESETWASPEFLLEWKHTTTKCGSSVFQLAPSAPPTGECATGSSESVWPTVVANDDNKSPEAHLRMKANMPGGPRTQITSLQVLAKATWPTPGGKTTKNWKDPKQLKEGGLQTCLPDALYLAQKAAWTTPQSHDIHKGQAKRTARSSATGGCKNLNDECAASGPITYGCLARTESFVVRLVTLSAWLMGYTAAYLAHWATASSGWSRRKSSGP